MPGGGTGGGAVASDAADRGTDVVAEPFRWPLAVRYYEVDQQGVVFNMWYLGYLDEAVTAWFAHLGLPYAQMMSEGLDFMLVHTELDWTAGVGFGDAAEVEVALAAVGRTSFTVDFAVLRARERVCTARTVYVMVATDGSGKRPVPDGLRALLGRPAPLRDPATAP